MNCACTKTIELILIGTILSTTLTLGKIRSIKTTITCQSPLSADCILIAMSATQTNLLLDNLLNSVHTIGMNLGTKSQKSSFKVDFSLVTVATHV